MSYSDTYGEGVHDGAGNIDGDPSFVTFTEDDSGVGDDFHLSEGSPCLDSGPQSDLDPDGSIADMGAYGGPQGSIWPGEFTGCVETVGPIEVGETISGDLTSDDGTDGPRGSAYYHDSYVLWGEDGESIRIAHNAGYDAYLYLLSSDCIVIASNDDSGGGFNSLINYTFAGSGWRTVVATSYSSRATGSYTLAVE